MGSLDVCLVAGEELGTPCAYAANKYLHRNVVMYQYQ